MVQAQLSMYEEIILIEPASSSGVREIFREKYPYPPLGILSIASFLKMHGYIVHVLDLMIEDYSMGEFKQRLKDLCFDPIAVGITLYTDCFHESLEIASITRGVFPKVPIIMGGPHATFRPNEILTYTHIDFVIRHEGESAMVELLEHIRHPDAYELDAIQSLSYRDQNDEVHSNPIRPFITNLDILPFPDYESLSVLRMSYKETFMLVTSRGCPGDCVFCASRAMSGKRYRFHSAEWVFSLAYEYNLRYGFPMLAFLDDTFTVHYQRAKSFCRYLLDYWPGGSLPRWACKSRVDRVNDDICAVISQAGCLSIHIGVESADQSVLDSINKHIRLEQSFQAIRIARKYGMRVDCSFIIGHHSDTLVTIEKTVLLAIAVRDNNIGNGAIGISTPFPGTPLFEQSNKLGIEITKRNWRKYNLGTPIYHTKNFTENDLKRALYFFNHESLNGKMEIGLTNKKHREFRVRIDQLINDLRNATTD